MFSVGRGKNPRCDRRTTVFINQVLAPMIELTRVIIRTSKNFDQRNKIQDLYQQPRYSRRTHRTVPARAHTCGPPRANLIWARGPYFYMLKPIFNYEEGSRSVHVTPDPAG